MQFSWNPYNDWQLTQRPQGFLIIIIDCYYSFCKVSYLKQAGVTLFFQQKRIKRYFDVESEQNKDTRQVTKPDSSSEEGNRNKHRKFNLEKGQKAVGDIHVHDLSNKKLFHWKSEKHRKKVKRLDGSKPIRSKVSVIHV